MVMRCTHINVVGCVVPGRPGVATIVGRIVLDTRAPARGLEGRVVAASRRGVVNALRSAAGHRIWSSEDFASSVFEVGERRYHAVVQRNTTGFAVLGLGKCDVGAPKIHVAPIEP